MANTSTKSRQKDGAGKGTPTNKSTQEEGQLNVWIPRGLLKKMKQHGINNDLSLKQITINALEVYLGQS